MRSRPSSLSGLLLVAAVLALALVPAMLPRAHADSANTIPLSGGITGPSGVGTGLHATYTVTAQGGPAEALNGTQVGTYSYTSSISAVNTTGARVTPVSGVLVNFSVTVTLIAPNVTEPLTIYVLVTSTLGTANATQNFSYLVNIVQPFQLAATIVVGSTGAVGPFDLTVQLDNQPIGTIVVNHGLAAGASYPIQFSYVPQNLAPGWHTFTISLAQLHGLVAFSGGEQVLSVSFFVTGGGPDNTAWYLTGAAVFVGAILIWSTTVSGRRRGRPKK
ncbi:MAG: hypothetical protein L3K06_05085 [Thermoplasmata archaeon]|nr:hypothetical protein [Thermoplasmata archaeon]